MSDAKYLYAVEHPHGYYKVGRAKEPFDRASQIQIGSPYDLTFKFAVRYLHSRHKSDIETEVHERLDKYSVRGEWFDVAKSTLLRVLHNVVEDDDVEGFYLTDVERQRERLPKYKKRHNARPSI